MEELKEELLTIRSGDLTPQDRAEQVATIVRELLELHHELWEIASRLDKPLAG